jgi:hypothetical protein
LQKIDTGKTYIICVPEHDSELSQVHNFSVKPLLIAQSRWTTPLKFFACTVEYKLFVKAKHIYSWNLGFLRLLLLAWNKNSCPIGAQQICCRAPIGQEQKFIANRSLANFLQYSPWTGIVFDPSYF